MAKVTKKATQTNAPKAAKAKDYFIRRLLREFSEGGGWKKIKDEALEFFDERCAYCGRKLEKIHVDHAYPINRKHLGTNRPGNLVPSCPSCNLTKKGLTYEEYCEQEGYKESKKKIARWMKKCGYVPLTATEARRKKINNILDMAHEDIDRLLLRYIDLIELLK